LSVFRRDKKLYVKIFGGLGNQLFQYAYGQERRSEGLEPRYIVDAATPELPRVFDLPRREILENRSRLALTARKAYARFIVRRFANGFFQDRLPEPRLREMLSFRRAEEYRKSPWFAQVTAANSVAVHVRGGDYITPSAFHGWGDVCDAGYYEAATKLVETATRAPTYFLFTNDEAFALSMLPADVRSRMTVVGDEFEGDPGFHLFLMGACRHNIIANSTYSWWGAFLGNPDGRIVVAPERWKTFVCPPEWRRI